MNSKTGSLVLAVVLSFCLWLYVITTVSTETERPYSGVQITLEGESLLRERNLMIISDTDLTAKVDLKGSRQDLNNLNPSNLTLITDLSGIYTAGEYQLGYSIDFPSNIPSGAVTVMNREPGTVTVVIAERISRNIPVRVSYIGDAADGFIADKVRAELEYEEVAITGPREVVEQIDHAHIEVDCTERTETIVESFRFMLCNAQNEPVDAAMITTNIDQIRVMVPVFLTKRVDLVLAINPGGGATEATSLIQIEPAYIDVSGSESALKELDRIVIGTLNLGDIPEEMEKTYTINLPEGVTNLSNITEAAVKVSFPELEKKEFVISRIDTLNVPEGMEADLMTKQLTVTVRGTKEQMAKLTVEQIAIQIDLTGVENTAAVEAKVIFPEGFDQVGAVGKYSVNVKVAETPDTKE